eukprot:488071_1
MDDDDDDDINNNDTGLMDDDFDDFDPDNNTTTDNNDDDDTDPSEQENDYEEEENGNDISLKMSSTLLSSTPDPIDNHEEDGVIAINEINEDAEMEFDDEMNENTLNILSPMRS